MARRSAFVRPAGAAVAYLAVATATCVVGGCVTTQLLGFDHPVDGGTDSEGTVDAGASPDVSERTGDASPSIDASDKVTVSLLATGLGYHACALLSNATIKCWGFNDYGQLGLGDTQNRGDDPNEMGENLPVVDLGSGVRAKAIAIGPRHTCALVDDGRIKCWGQNDDGQLGLGDRKVRGDARGEMGDALPFVDLGSGRTALSVGVGQTHTCALLDNRQIKCWGDNAGGQLGQGDVVDRGTSPGQMGDALPSVDLAATSVSALFVGANHSCAIFGTGSFKCWGDNGDGQLGLGDRGIRGNAPGEMGSSLPPVVFPPQLVVREASLGAGSCAHFADRTIRCWGANTQGQSGIGTTAYDPGTRPGDLASLPSVSLGTSGVAAMVSSGAAHACALLDGGGIKCWGYNGSGQLGLGDRRDRGGAAQDMGDALPSVELGADRRAIQIASGAEHVCALLDDRSVKCWGRNGEGQLGQGDRTIRGDAPGALGDALAPVPIVGP